MDTVYETTNGTDAQLIVDVLGGAGIEARIVGEHIAPYSGPLGSVRVLVSPEQADAARACLAEWEATPVDAEPAAPRAPERPTRDAFVVLGLAAALLLTVWYFTGA